MSDCEEEQLNVGDIINNEFKILSFINKGSFGSVYKAEKNDNKIVAMKTESDNNKLLYKEYIKYKDIQHIKGIPNIYWYGNEYNKNILVMSCLGNNLGTLFKYCEKQFSLKTLCMISYQIVNILEQVHDIGYIHKDIKPDNILIGYKSNRNRIYLVDFGLSNEFIVNHEHIPYTNNRHFAGTYRYSSIRNHVGSEQSRRDDLESYGYTIIYFFKGCLPWENIKCKEKEKRIKIFNIKKKISCEELCTNTNSIIYDYIKYTRLLRFKEKPDYEKIRNLFLSYFSENSNEKFDYMYDWIIKAQKKNIINK